MSGLVEVLSLALFVAEVGGAEDGSGERAWHLLEPKTRKAWGVRTISMLTALEAAGYRMVPVEPTERMVSVYWATQGMDRADCETTWAALLNAAPKVDSPAAEGGSRDE